MFNGLAILLLSLSNRGNTSGNNYSSYLGHQYRPRKDGRYEMIIVRDPSLDLYQSIFSTFPKLSEYSTADLYEQHPIKSDYWAYRGRADDIIAFSSGEKTNPISFEKRWPPTQKSGQPSLVATTSSKLHF